MYLWGYRGWGATENIKLQRPDPATKSNDPNLSPPPAADHMCIIMDAHAKMYTWYFVQGGIRYIRSLGRGCKACCICWGMHPY